MMRPHHKFGAKRTEVNGRRYDSKKEASYAATLPFRQRSGTLLFWLEQVPLRLPGGIVYRLDFLEFHTDGSCHFVEVKGFETSEWKMKRKLIKESYPWIELEII